MLRTAQRFTKFQKPLSTLRPMQPKRHFNLQESMNSLKAEASSKATDLANGSTDVAIGTAFDTLKKLQNEAQKREIKGLQFTASLTVGPVSFSISQATLE